MLEISLTHQDPPQQQARSTTATRYTNMLEISLTHQDPPQQYARSTTATRKIHLSNTQDPP